MPCARAHVNQGVAISSEYSGNPLRSFKEYFGKDAEVDVPMNAEAEEAVIITAGRDV